MTDLLESLLFLLSGLVMVGRCTFMQLCFGNDILVIGECLSLGRKEQVDRGIFGSEEFRARRFRGS